MDSHMNAEIAVQTGEWMNDKQTRLSRPSEK